MPDDVLGSVCCKHLIPPVVRGEAGVLTYSVQHKGLAAICDRGTGKGNWTICQEIWCGPKTNELCLCENELS